MNNKLLYQIALTRIDGVGDITARNLLATIGDEEEVFRTGRKALMAINGLNSKLVSEILNPEVLVRAEKELAFVEKNNLQTFFISDEKYPHRLRECSDAPVLLYFDGNADFNVDKVISIVGTRNATNYGNVFCEIFLKELSAVLPDVLIVSGLAYGIDIQAHRQALKCGLRTIGVLAHGLDRIYPAAHKATANEMTDNGGLLTEFASGTEPDKFNFVRRNRIVAGMADAVIVVESDIKGGSLITAEIAGSYCKDVFALPGRTVDPKSAGCNKLIAQHKADLFYSTEYFLQQMGWDEQSAKNKKQPRQQNLFIDLSPDEQVIVDKLSGTDGLHIDQLAREAGIPAYELFPILLELEMKNIIKNMPGNRFGIV